MIISFEVPNQIGHQLRDVVPDLERESQEALGLKLFREEKLSHSELGQMLGLNRTQTDSFLVRNKEFSQCLTLEEVEEDVRALEEFFNMKKQ